MGPKDLLLNGLQKGKPPIPHELRSALKKLKERELLLLQNYVNACSAAQQRTARWLLDNCVLIRDYRVVEIGAASGMGALAAKMAGAISAVAIDINPMALEAANYNALLNNVSIEVAESFDIQPNSFIVGSGLFEEMPELETLLLNHKGPCLYSTFEHLITPKDPAWELLDRVSFTSQKGSCGTLCLWGLRIPLLS
jgi:hypothetical protein